MGVEDWEAKYKVQGKNALNDFLNQGEPHWIEEDSESAIIRMSRACRETLSTSPQPSREPSGRLQAAYPEGYETIDRRRRKRLRDPGGIFQTESERDEQFPPDLALLRQKRGELVLRQVAEMEEEDENMTPCLRPYRNGLLYKTRMWAKNKLENTLENYVAYQEEEAARMRGVSFDPEVDELEYPLGSEEEFEEYLADAMYSENGRGYSHGRFANSYGGFSDKPLAYRDKKSGKNKLGGWAPEAMLSPVEEPSDEYVDPMDELQCLVETVSEYLAEKEEEINKYGSLPKSPKSRLSSQGSTRTESVGEDPSSNSKEAKGEAKAKDKKTEPEPGVAGVKSAMTSLFSSFTEKVGSGPKQPTPTPAEKSEAPSSAPSDKGLSKLFSFIPKSPSPTPVAVVSPDPDPPPTRKFSLLPFQSEGKTQQGNYPVTTNHVAQNTNAGRAQEPPQTQQTSKVNSVLGKINPLKMFAGEESMNSTDISKPTFRTSSKEESFDKSDFEVKSVFQPQQPKVAGSRGLENVNCGSQYMHTQQKISQENLYPATDIASRAANVKPVSQPPPPDTSFFSPFKKSFSSLITPVNPPNPPPQSITVFPVFRSTEDMSVPEEPKPVKPEGGMLSGFLRFASGEDVSGPQAASPTPTNVQQRAPAAGATPSSNPGNRPQPQSRLPLHESQPKPATETGWFSNLFKAETPNPGQPAEAGPTPQGPRPRGPPGPNQGAQGGPPRHHQGQRPMQGRPPQQGPFRQPTPQPEPQGLFSGLFKATSSEDVSSARPTTGGNPNQPQQSGLLSGFLKFASTGDLASVSQQQQQAPVSSQSAQIIHPQAQSQNQPPLPQQNAPPPQTGGLLSGFLKFTENVTSDLQVSPAPQQRAPPASQVPQQQPPPNSSQQAPPQQGGLLSGLFKLASTENVSSSPSPASQQQQQPVNPQTQQQGYSQNIQGQRQRNAQLSRAPSTQGGPQQEQRPGNAGQPQQAPPQQGGLLSGLFKLASSDNIATTQTTVTQPQPTSSQNQPPQTQQQRRNLQRQSSNISTQPQPSPVSQQNPKPVSAPTQSPSQSQAQAQDNTNQTGILSGLFSKLTSSSEDVQRTTQTAPVDTQKQQSTPLNGSGQQSRTHRQLPQLPSKTSPQEAEEKPSTQQGFFSGLFGRTTTEQVPSTKPEQGSTQNTAQRTVSTSSPSVLSNSVTASQHINTPGPTFDPLNVYGRPGMYFPISRSQRSRSMLGGYMPIAANSESLDLRTSASYARSMQNRPSNISNSTGNLTQLYYYQDPYQSRNPMMSYSVENLHSFPLGSPVLSHQSLHSSTNSVHGMKSQYGCQDPVTPYSEYGDEGNWIQASIIWQQFNNESQNHYAVDTSYAQTLDGTSQQTSQPWHTSGVYSNQPSMPAQPYANTQYSQEQLATTAIDVQRDVSNNSAYRERLWSSYTSLDRLGNQDEDGALNLSTKRGNAKFGKCHSFNEGSSYSLNRVSYHEGYYEESAPNLSYAANTQYGFNGNPDYYPQQGNYSSHVNLNRRYDDWGYPIANGDMDDPVYLEEGEWYHQWLSLLEQGMWWPADDGDCGYFVYTDYEYIYALLTDGSGQYVYACTPDGEIWGNGHPSGSYPNAWLQDEMVIVCGFKMPLYNEDELFWLPGDQPGAQLLNGPLDLSMAYRKGNEIMNLNFERFSQMFENSYFGQRQPNLNASSYRLNKVRMDPRQHVPQDPSLQAVDLSSYSNNHGPSFTEGVKELLSQKVPTSLGSIPTTNSTGSPGCYKPRERRRSPSIVKVKHVDDTTEEEWRKHVAPGEEQPNRSVKKISSLLSSIVGKSPESETAPAAGRENKGLFSTGFQSLKSRIIKDDSPTGPQSVNNRAQPPSTTSRILPTPPSTQAYTPPQTLPASQKPRLARQTTMSQQPTVPLPSTSLPSHQYARGSPGVPTTSPSQPGVQSTPKPMEKTPEQTQGGIFTRFKSAVGMEEPTPEPAKSLEPITRPQQVGPASKVTDSKEPTGKSSILGSIGDFFNAETTVSQPPSKPAETQQMSATSQIPQQISSRPKGLQKQQTLSTYGLEKQTETQLPSKSMSQIFPPTASTVPTPTRSETTPPVGQAKQEPPPKPAGGLFGSIGDMLSGTPTPSTQVPSGTAPPKDLPGKGLLSMFGGLGQQDTPQTGTASGTQPPGAVPTKEPPVKGILSMFSGPTTQPTSQPEPTPTITTGPQQSRAPPPQQEQPKGLLSMFGGSSSQQTPAQSGSILGGLLSGPSTTNESPAKGLLGMFGGSSPQPPTSTTATANQASGAAQPTAAPTEPSVKGLFTVFGGPSAQPSPPQAGPLAGSSTPGAPPPSESPMKGLLSRFGAPSTPATPPSQPQPPTSAGPNAPGTAPPSESPMKGLLSMFGAPSTPAMQPPQAQASPPTVASATAAEQSPAPAVTSEQSNVPGATAVPTTSTVTSVQGSAAPAEQPSAPGAAPSSESTGKGLLSMLGGPSAQPPQSQATTEASSAAGAASGLLSMFGGPSPQQKTPQTSGGLLGGLLSGPSSSASTAQQSTPQAGSLLGGLFSGSSGPTPSQQQSAPQTGSLLGGLFSGPSGPAPRPQQSAPQAGSLLGGLFSGPSGPTPQQSAPQAGSLLGGLLSGPSSSTPSPAKGLFSMFGAPSPQQQPPVRPPGQQPQVRPLAHQPQVRPPAQQQPQVRLPAQQQPQPKPPLQPPGQGPLGQGSELGPTVTVPPSVPASEPPKEIAAKDLVPCSGEFSSQPPKEPQPISSQASIEPQQPTVALSSTEASATIVTTTTTTAADSSTTATLSQPVSSETSEVQKDLSASSETTEAAKALPASSEASEPPKGFLSMLGGSSPLQSTTQPGSLLSGILPGSAGTDSPAKGLLSMFSGPSPLSSETSSSATPITSTTITTSTTEATTTEAVAGTACLSDASKPSTEITTQVSKGQVESAPDAASQGPAPPKETPAAGLLSMFGGSGQQGAPSQVGSLLGGILPGSTESKDVPGKGLFSMFSGPSPPAGPGQAGAAQGAAPPPTEPPGKGLFSMFGGSTPQQSAPQATSLFGGILPGAAATKEVPGKGLLSMFGGPSPAESGTPKTGAFGLLGSFMEEKKPEPPKPQEAPVASVGPVPEQTAVPTAEQKSQGQTVTVQTQMSLSQAPSSATAISPLPEPSAVISGRTDGMAAASDQVSDKPLSASAPDSQTTPESSIKTETPSSVQPGVATVPSTQEAKPIDQPPAAGAQTEQRPGDAAKAVLDSSAEVVSGFMSKMFSGPSAPSGGAPSTGFFSQAQSSFFKPAPAPQQQQQQTKQSLFGFTSSLPTDSLKSDLFGMFKTPEPPKSAPQQKQPPGVRPPTASRGQGPSPSPAAPPLGTEPGKPGTGASPAPTSPQIGSQPTAKAAVVGDVIHEKPMVIVGEPAKDTDKSGLLPDGIPYEPLIAQQPQSTELPPKSVFEMPGLSGSAFGFMTGTGEPKSLEKSLGSLFSSPPTVTQADGAGLLTGFKTFSAGLFQDEKPSTPPQPGIVTTQPKANGDHSVITNGTQIESEVKEGSDSIGKKELLASTNSIDKPEIYISKPEIDPLHCSSLKDKDPLFDSTSDLSSGMRHDKDLLSAKRLVAA